MFTISDIIADIDKGCALNNMLEDCFSYRVVYFINEDGKGAKYYIDTPYSGLRKELESIIKNNLTTTNSIVVAAVTVRKDGQPICLLSRSYLFSLNEYFRQIEGQDKYNGKNRNTVYGRYAVR